MTLTTLETLITLKTFLTLSRLGADLRYCSSQSATLKQLSRHFKMSVVMITSQRKQVTSQPLAHHIGLLYPWYTFILPLGL